MARRTDADGALLPAPVSSGRHRSTPFWSALCALLLFHAGAALAAELPGRVVRVSDGDTLTVLDEERVAHRVRLAGIDAPEKNQRFGAESRASLLALVQGRSVTVTWLKHDRYGRLVGEVYRRERHACDSGYCTRSDDVGLSQIASGLAWHYRRYRSEQSPEQRRRYARAEETARARREGLWQDPQPVPPWEYRGSHNRAAAVAGAEQLVAGTFRSPMASSGSPATE